MNHALLAPEIRNILLPARACRGFSRSGMDRRFARFFRPFRVPATTRDYAAQHAPARDTETIVAVW